MKLNLRNAALILLAGMVILVTGVFVIDKTAKLGHPTILTGLAVEFIGTIWLVLCLNQRRKKIK